MSKIRIGTSGWSYDEWRGDFYPDGLVRKRELEYAAGHFDSIEINGSFYSLLTPRSYERYRAAAPRRFVYAVKGSQFITHNKKLADIDLAMANFLASGVLRLEEKLGPMLWQLPARARYDPERLETFLAALPHDTGAAVEWARRHDSRVPDPWLETGRRRRIRHALEVRSEAFFTPEVVRILRRTGTALVISDAADWPRIEETTAGFVYIRLHGATETYGSRYEDHELDWWAGRIREWHEGAEPDDARRITDRKPPARKTRDVYVYFDNDKYGYAPHDALRLARILERGGAT